MTQRAYLDWNATAPLRAEAREAMLRALDAANPSSVHAEGREARAIVERARAQVAALAGCEPGDVAFTSGATEAAALALSGRQVWALPTEHDCVLNWATQVGEVDADGRGRPPSEAEVVCWPRASGETGVMQDPPAASPDDRAVLSDLVQAAGRVPLRFAETFGLLSAHKLGGPKGVGALLVREGAEPTPILRGGGQELRRRPGTENVAGIAGFGAAAEAALRDLAAGVWERVENLRDLLEARLKDAAPDLILVGEGARRLPNTSCFAVPGWKGETQVMQMDLAGFAISAGSACASGKVGPSRALRAMGFDAATAGSAIRVSLGPTTTEGEVMRFADAWTERCRRFHRKSA